MVVTDDLTCDQMRQQLIDRVGSLGWVVEGVIQSIAMSDVDAATRLWGDEAVDLLWERQMLVSPDGNPNHREVRLAADAQAWATARREELLLAPISPNKKQSTLEQLVLSPRALQQREQRRTHLPAMASVPR